jgi:hypothetical protein
MNKFIFVIFFIASSGLFTLCANSINTSDSENLFQLEKVGFKDIPLILSLAGSRMIEISNYSNIESLKYFIVFILISYFLTQFFWRNSIVNLTKQIMLQKIEEDPGLEPRRIKNQIQRKIEANLIKPVRDRKSIVRQLLSEKTIFDSVLLIFIFLLSLYLNQVFMLLLSIETYFTLPCLFTVFFFVIGIFRMHLSKWLGQFIFRSFRKKNLQISEKNLLILRVFGNPGTTSFLFDWFAEKWRLFGTSITIADPILVEQEFRIMNILRPESYLFLTYFTSNMIAVIGFFIIPFFYGESGKINSIFIFTLALYILVPVVYWVAILILRFWDSKDFNEKMGDSNFFIERNSRLEFPRYTLFCFDSRWKKTVELAVKKVDLVLMDVRDYSLERAGSSWELGFLAHFFPLSRVLFLVDNEEKEKIIIEIFKKEISAIPQGSPNDKDIVLNFLIPDKRNFGIKASIDVVESLYGLIK